MSLDPFIDIPALADGSAIAKYNWKNRGRAPSGYIRGMAVAFGREYCCLNAGHEVACAIAGATSDDASTDALAWYADEFDALGMDNSTAGADVLRHVFVLLTGLGMRESSGRHCEGRDMSATNFSAESAEAGLFQVSHNSISSHTLLQTVVDNYQGSTDFSDVFSVGVKCNAASRKNWGTGDGADFQALTKQCPAFAVEYSALALRSLRKHWGPINRKSAELRTECDELFGQVASYIDENGISDI